MARVVRGDWKRLVQAVESLDTWRHARRPQHSDAAIVLVALWARANGQPIRWACQPGSWPLHERRRGLPDPSTVSRRLRSPSVQALIGALVPEPEAAGMLAYVVDGKPLVVSRHSTDPDARHGYGAGGMHKGYKLHLICDLQGRVHAVRVTPLNMPEQEVARQLVAEGRLPGGYLLGDSAYDWEKLHRECEKRGARLLVHRRPSRKGRGTRTGTGRVGPARLACIASTETPGAVFAPSLLRQRRVIERVFGRLETRWEIGHPPFNIRTLHRVSVWVAAALILDRFTTPQANRRAA